MFKKYKILRMKSIVPVEAQATEIRTVVAKNIESFKRDLDDLKSYEGLQTRFNSAYLKTKHGSALVAE